MPNSKTLTKTLPDFSLSFSRLSDPRRIKRGNFKYPLEEILFLVISAVISDAKNWSQIQVFAESKLEWLRQYFAYENGTPSEDVLASLFARLDSDQFCQCFVSWINTKIKLNDGEVIAIDGKTVCGSEDKRTGSSAIHVVSAFASQNRVSIAQRTVSQKSNEITAIPELLELLTIEGNMVSIDAMGCQKEIAQQIRKKKADYTLMVKGNQKSLLEEIEAVFTNTAIASQCTDNDMGHGRIEMRNCSVINDLSFLDEKRHWKDLKSVIRIERRTINKQTDTERRQVAYYISSAKESAKKFNEIIRSHWSIENNLHWSLDVLFQEDNALRKKGNSAANFNIIAKTALTLIEKEPTPKRSRVQKMKRCALDDNFREKTLQF